MTNKPNILPNRKAVIIGTHGIGKTTLINELFQDERLAYSDVVKIEEQAREWLENFNKNYYDLDYQSYLAFEHSLYNYFKFAFLQNKSFISDRSPLDVLAYASQRIGEKELFPLIKDFCEFRNELFKDTKIFFYKLGKLPPKLHAEFIEERIENYIEQLVQPKENDEYNLQLFRPVEIRRFTREDLEVVKEEIINYLLGKENELE